MAITVAIIGSGPAGFYAADAIQKSNDDAEIDIIERLPTPYGLIRGGVAPDHQTTKKVTKKFEKTALLGGMRYFGNVEVGRDVTLGELRDMYDVVILAIGAPADRVLTVPGADKIGVHGSAAFVGWYNGHPDFVELELDLNVETAVVIGNGNVALDIARVLVRSKSGRAKTDLPLYARAAIDASPIKDVYVLGRRGPLEAKFTNVELREMLDLSECAPVVDAADLPASVPDDMENRARRLAEKNLETLRAFSERDPQSMPKRAHFGFYAQPVEILGDSHVTGIRMERTRVENGRASGTGETYDIPCGLVVAAIGYRADPIPGLPYDDALGIIPNDRGKIGDGLYAVGWIKRGPSGVISSSRPDGVEVAEHIAADFPDGGLKPGRVKLEALLKERKVRVVHFEDWQRIEQEEIARAEQPQPRRKFTAIDDMIDHLEGRDS
ncbi:FAD-dependent oxidoreductase [Thalassospiraceae bacterium LMO-JJ14]|nr:FAD-dependent oxidoreductase [Thalassospiraceae bacterium LMO-JJ14]